MYPLDGQVTLISRLPAHVFRSFLQPHNRGPASAKGIDVHMDTQTRTLSQPTAPRLLYSREEAAYQLSLSVRSLDHLIAGKKIEIRRIGSRILIPHEELVRLATSARVRSVT
jgi:hypothetical protein